MRQLFRGRGSSIVAVLTLALGIGVTTAVLSVIDATMLPPLPYPDPEQLVDVHVEEIQADGEAVSPSPSMDDMRFVERADDLFSIVAGYGTVAGGRRLAEGPEPELISVEYFTENYLSMYGVTPQNRLISWYSATCAASAGGSPRTARIIRLRAVCSVLTNSTTSVL